MQFPGATIRRVKDYSHVGVREPKSQTTQGASNSGWTNHKIYVTPSFHGTGLNLRVTGHDRNEVKDLIYEAFQTALEQDVEYWMLPEEKQVVRTEWVDECQCQYVVVGEDEYRWVYRGLAEAQRKAVELSRGGGCERSN